MHNEWNQNMNDDLDSMLEQGLLSVPDDFSERVMSAVWLAPSPIFSAVSGERTSERTSERTAKPEAKNWRSHLQWCGLVCGAAVGVIELLSFIFAMWATTTAY